MVGILATMLGLAQGATSPAPIWWHPNGDADIDEHIAFRGHFSLTSSSASLRIHGVSEYLVWLDGKLIHNGPPRFAQRHPEYQVVPISVGPGLHTLAVHVHDEGVTTRILSKMTPYLWCEVADGTKSAAIDWKCERITGYRPQAGRISDILGWTDWFDTNFDLGDWKQPNYDDTKWHKPVPVDGVGHDFIQAKTAPVRLNDLPVKLMARGSFVTTYGYERDDPAVRFFLDDLDPKGTPAQGVWRRYDLGRVRLGRPKITLDVPKGTVVEMAICEQLQHSRVHPWLNLSGSRSSTVDHFVAHGGVQEFMPFTPKGGRFVEVHVRAPGAKFVREAFLERTYYPDPAGSFECSDPLLNKIWRTGVETMRACSEDAFVDCPTRERGQWTGDVASVATDIAGVAYGDLALSRRALVQAAQAARSDGLVAGVGPGDPGYLSTYAAQWVTACVHYWELTGDQSLLHELFPAAMKNMAAFAARSTSDGVSDGLGWAFVDWGYVRNDGPSDMALNIHYLMALRSMLRWEIADDRVPGDYDRLAEALETKVKAWLRTQVAKPGGWKNVGYQRASLALLAGLVDKDQVKPCIQMIESHLLSCFPNDPNGPRLSDPGVADERVMTPYFAHFSFAALLEYGEIDFVLDQYRKCWGWALGDGRTTWLEVFDTRWSHCHEWSGCPTWQLSRYVLGLRPRFDLGERVFDFSVLPGNLKNASGDVPYNGGKVHVEWKKTGSGVTYVLASTNSIHVRIDGKEVTIKGRYEGTQK